MEDYVKFEDWYGLYEKYKDIDFTLVTNREAFNNDFTELSIRYLKGEYAYYNKALIDDHNVFFDLLAEVWNDYKPFVDRDKPLSEQVDKIVLAYKSALGTIFYASDRMNFNRWLLIRLRLNEGIE